jgi:hypothetical protein
MRRAALEYANDTQMTGVASCDRPVLADYCAIWTAAAEPKGPYSFQYGARRIPAASGHSKMRGG